MLLYQTVSLCYFVGIYKQFCIDTSGCVVGELSLVLVVSSKAHARLISVDASDALQMPGVVDFISHKDVPGENCFGSIVPDQTIFAVDKVSCVTTYGTRCNN